MGFHTGPRGMGGSGVLRHVHMKGFRSRSVALLCVVGAAALFAPSAVPPPASERADAATLPDGFTESIVLSGLTNPTVVRFSKDGRVFVAEKSGLIKVFDSVSDTTPSTFADLRTNVYNFWDRGLLGMALHPNFPSTPYVYVLYAYDHVLGDPAPPPKWGTPGATSDACPNPPGATTDGCVVSGRLSRLQAAGDAMTGSEQVLVEDWCQQYPSHSIGTVEFGPDGALYASGGDGAHFFYVDYGQEGDPVNPCGDPGGPAPSPPTAEGGALRSQDLRTEGDPVTLDGTMIRVDPTTGAGASGNPLSGHADANARRIIAYGLRNPFRFAIRPGSSEIWIGNVGWNDWEEINRIPNPTDSVVENFGWPCYEGNSRQAGYEAAGLAICENLYAQPNADTKPYFAYHKSEKVVPGESCETGSSSLSGLSFEFAPTGSTFPAEYEGALFFADYSRKCIWAMTKSGNPIPSPGSIRTFVAAAAGPVNLEFGPGGALYYVDFDGGTIRRIQYGTTPPPAVSYKAPVHYATGTNAHGVAVADLNRDGKPDLAVSNSGSSTVSVLLGSGTGTFGSATNFGTGAAPKSVTAGDLNGDGSPDLVTANQNGNSVSVLLGTGTGSLGPAAHYAVCSGAHEATVGEFNGDGRRDVAVACHGGSVISVLLGNGSGGLGAAVTYQAGSAPHSIDAGDFTRDGHQDLAVANFNGNSVSVLVGRGDGTFASPVNYAVGSGPHTVRMGDFDGNGIPDLVTGNFSSDTVSVLLGTGSGTFTAATSYPTGRVPAGVAVGDLNGDGKLDLVTSNTGGNYPSGVSSPGGDQVSVLVGTGNGSFGSPTNFLTGHTPFDVAVAELDGDGKRDIVTANWFSHNASVLLTSGAPPPIPPPGSTYLSDFAWTSATNGWGPVEKDMSNGDSAAGDGGTITLNGTTYQKGLGAHALSDIRYAISNCTRFKSDVGVDDAVGSNGSVVFQVFAGATKVYDSGTMTGTTATKVIDVDISGASELRLVVGNANGSISYDHADWALARIECSGGGGDTTAPTVTGRTPADGATGVARSVSPTATFSEAMDASTITTTTFTLVKQGTTSPVPATVSYASQTATLDPSADLEAGATYTATVKGGSAGAKDVAGNPLASDVSWSFTTATSGTTSTYLSDLTWASATNGWGPVEKDMSVGGKAAGDGGTITLNGTTYQKGLGAHASSEIRYAISNCTRFKSDVGVDDGAAHRGSVVFQVFAGATKVYDSGTMTGTTATKVIDVDISGASELRLVVTDAGDGNKWDHADWAAARIECSA